MALSREDLQWMRLATRLARRGYPAPNPHVGACIIKDGELVGHGYHPYAGAPHAEIFALQQAGERARGATLYVTLEPCCHYGRTPPCTQAVLKAGIARVVVGMTDPNLEVSGKGIQQLRQAGVRVELLDPTEPQARVLIDQLEALNRPFLHRHREGRVLVTLKCALSLDGKIATRTGDSKWITTARTRRYAHRLRAEHGSVLVGVGTVLKDNPQLTVRLPGVRSQPLRIVLDTHLRTPLEAQVLDTRSAPTVLVCALPMPPHAEQYRQRGVEVLALPTDSTGRVSLAALLDYLNTRHVNGVLVEGGSQVLTAFLKARLADRIAFFYAPKLIGGETAPTPYEGEGITEIAESLPVNDLRLHRLGTDWLVEGSLR